MSGVIGHSGVSNQPQTVITINDSLGRFSMSLEADGSGKFGDTYDEIEALWVLRDVFSHYTGVKDYNSFRFENFKGELLVESTARGSVKFGPKVKDQRLISFFQKLACVKKCECGSDKCGLPRHSSWCPKGA